MALVPNVKDSRWLTLEVCREFQRSKCSRTDDECKYAHPPPHVEIQNGRVTCCYDSIKGKCNRKDPPCKYLHPPQQLKEVLLQNGRNNLLLKNIQMQMMTGVPTPIIQSGLVPMQVHPSYAAAFQNAAAVQNASLNPFLGAQTITQLQPTALYSTLDQQTVMATAMPASGSMPTAVSNANSMPPTNSSNSSQKMLRTDRLETSSSNAAVSNSLQNHASESVLWTGSPPAANSLLSATANPYSPAAGTAIYFQPQMFEMLNPTAAGFQAAAAAAAKKRPRDPSDELFLSVGGMSAYPGTLPLVKRTALADFKSGLPVYQPSAAAATASPYQQALTAIQYQPTYVPMSLTSHPPSLQRY